MMSREVNKVIVVNLETPTSCPFAIKAALMSPSTLFWASIRLIFARNKSKLIEMYLPSNSYVVAFLNNDNESQRARTLLNKVAAEIQQIRIHSDEDNVPRL